MRWQEVLKFSLLNWLIVNCINEVLSLKKCDPKVVRFNGAHRNEDWRFKIDLNAHFQLGKFGDSEVANPKFIQVVVVAGKDFDTYHTRGIVNEIRFFSSFRDVLEEVWNNHRY